MFDNPKKKEDPKPVSNTSAKSYEILLRDFPQLKGMIDALAIKDKEAREHKPIKDDIMFDNVKNLLTEDRPTSNYELSKQRIFDKSGQDISDKPGQSQPAASSPMMDRIRQGNKPAPPPPSVQNRLIRNTAGHVVGAVGSKVRRINSATEIVVKNIMQEIAPVEEMLSGSIASFPTPMGSPSVVPTPMVAPQMQPKLCPCGSGKPASECCQQQTIKVHDAINTTMRNTPVDRGSRLRRITNVLGGL